MGKEDFSEKENAGTRRGGHDQGSFEGKDAEQRDGAQLRQDGAHSNTGIGDEKNPIEENEKE